MKIFVIAFAGGLFFAAAASPQPDGTVMHDGQSQPNQGAITGPKPAAPEPASDAEKRSANGTDASVEAPIRSQVPAPAQANAAPDDHSPHDYRTNNAFPQAPQR